MEGICPSGDEWGDGAHRFVRPSSVTTFQPDLSLHERALRLDLSTRSNPPFQAASPLLPLSLSLLPSKAFCSVLHATPSTVRRSRRRLTKGPDFYDRPFDIEYAAEWISERSRGEIRWVCPSSFSKGVSRGFWVGVGGEEEGLGHGCVLSMDKRYSRSNGVHTHVCRRKRRSGDDAPYRPDCPFFLIFDMSCLETLVLIIGRIAASVALDATKPAYVPPHMRKQAAAAPPPPPCVPLPILQRRSLTFVCGRSQTNGFHSGPPPPAAGGWDAPPAAYAPPIRSDGWSRGGGVNGGGVRVGGYGASAGSGGRPGVFAGGAGRRSDGYGEWRDGKHYPGPTNARTEKELFGEVGAQGVASTGINFDKCTLAFLRETPFFYS